MSLYRIYSPAPIRRLSSLPIHYFLVARAGFEPAWACGPTGLKSVMASISSPGHIRASARIRTPNLRIRSAALYPIGRRTLIKNFRIQLIEEFGNSKNYTIMRIALFFYVIHIISFNGNTEIQ